MPMKLQGLYFDCQLSASTERLQVTEFELHEGLSQLFTLTLTVVSPNSALDMQRLLLQKVIFTVFTHGIAQRQVVGIITELKRGTSGFHRTFYTLLIRPQLWMLTQRQNSRIFHFKTIPQVLSSLMREHGVNFKDDCRDQHGEREYITQKRETDYAFFQRLAAEEGISICVDN